MSETNQRKIIMPRFLVHQWACNYCDEDHKVFLLFNSDKQKYKKEYEGCGGYQGLTRKREHNKPVSQKQAKVILAQRLEMLETIKIDTQLSIDAIELFLKNVT